MPLTHRSHRSTLTQFLIEERRRFPSASGDFNALILDVALACKAIARAVALGELGGNLGDHAAGAGASINVQGETQKKLDVLSNEVFIRRTEWAGNLAGMASEEMDLPYQIPAQYPRGKYLLVFDPLDGSSNIDVNVSVGSIFSILRAPQAVIDSGRDVVAEEVEGGVEGDGDHEGAQGEVVVDELAGELAEDGLLLAVARLAVGEDQAAAAGLAPDGVGEVLGDEAGERGLGVVDGGALAVGGEVVEAAAQAGLEVEDVGAGRERAGVEVIDQLEDEYAALCARYPAGPLPDEVAEVGWLLEELRVSLFAQSLGTAAPISAKRVRAAMAAIPGR